MKFDKETIIVIMVCIVLITLCNIFLVPDRPQPPAKEQTVEKTAEVKKAETVSEKDSKTAEKPADKDQKAEQKDDKSVDQKTDSKAAPKAEQKPELKEAPKAEQKPEPKPAAAVAQETILENDHTIFYFNNNGILSKIVSKKIKKTKSDSLITFEEYPRDAAYLNFLHEALCVMIENAIS